MTGRVVVVVVPADADVVGANVVDEANVLVVLELVDGAVDPLVTSSADVAVPGAVVVAPVLLDAVPSEVQVLVSPAVMSWPSPPPTKAAATTTAISAANTRVA